MATSKPKKSSNANAYCTMGLKPRIMATETVKHLRTDHPPTTQSIRLTRFLLSHTPCKRCLELIIIPIVNVSRQCRTRFSSHNIIYTPKMAAKRKAKHTRVNSVTNTWYMTKWWRSSRRQYLTVPMAKSTLHPTSTIRPIHHRIIQVNQCDSSN